jgi:hypothetical protein
MQDSRPTLLWGIDEDSGKISALPASPLLLPAIVFYFLLWFLSLFYRRRIKSKPLPSNFNQKEWLANRTEYKRLCDKVRAGIELTPIEQIRFNTMLPRPSWAQPGEWWTY